MRAPVLLLALLSALLASEVVGYSRNSLLNHPEWVSGKKLLELQPMGTTVALTSRNLLAGDRLNLAAWHGFNELLYNRVVRLGRLQAQVQLDARAWLVLEYNRNRHSCYGVRLSRDEHLPGQWFEAEPGGRFRRTLALPTLRVGPGWHRLELSGTELRLDGVSVTLPEPAGEGVVGFRSGMVGVRVDNVRIWDTGGALLACESFRNARSFWSRVGLFGVLLGLAALLGRRWPHLTYAFYLLALSLLAYLLFDRYFWSYRYPYQQYLPWSYRKDLQLEPLESLRELVFQPFAGSDSAWTEGLPVAAWLGVPPRPLQPKPRDRYAVAFIRSGEARWLPDSSPGPAKNGWRVLVLGTSQTRGSGAACESESFPFRLQAHLAARAPELNPEVVGAGVPGSESGELVKRYCERLSSLKPDVVMVDLGNNDGELDRLEKNLRELADYNARRSIRTLFVEEAISREARGRLPVMAQRHERMRRVAREFGLPVADLHSYLNDAQVRDSGLLWWDNVHLTSYGQDLMAAYLANQELVGGD